MNLQIIDWVIVITVMVLLLCVTFYYKRYNRSVSDFLVANRLGRRYLLSVAAGFGGAASIIAAWEVTYNNGLAASWWQMLNKPIMTLLALFGFVVYRYRETRSMTLAQFFEMRYSRAFRIYSGFLCWLSGVLNFGVFPMITTRCIIAFFGLPETVNIFGFAVQTFPLVMFIYLAIAVYIACAGGQICIMITDFVQGMLLLIIFMLTMLFIMYKFGWGDIILAMRETATPGKSMINPFEAWEADGFNFWYYMISTVVLIYSWNCWQGRSGYSAASKTPHEGVMSAVVGSWRLYAFTLVMTMIPLACYAVMHLPQYADMAAAINQKLDLVADPNVRNQVRVPYFLVEILPPGFLGLFAVVILACAISNDDSYMHSWGTILIQDIIMPFRKKPFEPKQHMRLLRLGIIGVAVFSFFFSMFFPLKDFILMYFMITGAIYLSGAGAVMLGGLYWKRGSNAGAFTALTVGTVCGIGFIVLQQSWSNTLVPFLVEKFPHYRDYLLAHQAKFPIPAPYLTLITMGASTLSYILVSLLGPRHVHNMDKMLHRGEYADEKSLSLIRSKKFTFSKLIGITNNFTRFDSFLAWGSFLYSFIWWIIFIVVTLLAIFTTWLGDRFWEELMWWKFVPFSLVLGVVCSIWISWGGIRDAIALVKDLKNIKLDDSDNGFVQQDDQK